MNKQKRNCRGYYTRNFTIDGKRYYVYGNTPKELAEKEVQKRQEIALKIDKRKNPTLNQYYERWSSARKNEIKISTWRGQTQEYKIMSNVKMPELNILFGEMKLRDITIDDLRVVQAELAKERKTQTTNDYMSHLKHVFIDATKERVIDYNPCVLIRPLKRVEERARDTHHRALTIEEQERFFHSERLKSSYYCNVFKFLMLSGVRIGECGALKNSDIDTKNGVIHIDRTITRNEDGSYSIGTDAKTKAGKRTIPLTPELEKVIAEQRAINKLFDGNIINMDEVIFKAPERGLLMSTPVNREIKRICKLEGIEHFTAHAFRDTFATRCIEQGMNPRTLQALLGHSNFNITMSLYGHIIEDYKKTEMQSIVIAI